MMHYLERYLPPDLNFAERVLAYEEHFNNDYLQFIVFKVVLPREEFLLFIVVFMPIKILVSHLWIILILHLKMVF